MVADGRWAGSHAQWLKTTTYGPEQAGQSAAPQVPAGVVLESLSVVVTEALPADGLVLIPGYFAGATVAGAVGLYRSATPPTWFPSRQSLEVQIDPAMTSGRFMVVAHVVPLGS